MVNPALAAVALPLIAPQSVIGVPRVRVDKIAAYLHTTVIVHHQAALALLPVPLFEVVFVQSVPVDVVVRYGIGRQADTDAPAAQSVSKLHIFRGPRSTRT